MGFIKKVFHKKEIQKLLDSATELLVKEEYGLAAEKFNQILNYDSKIIKGIYGRGICEYYLGNYEEASNDLITVSKTEPNHSAHVYYYLCNISLIQRELNEADNFIDKFIELSKEKSEGYFLKSEIKLIQRNYQDALSFCKKSLEYVPGSYDSNILLSRIQIALELYDEAESSLINIIEKNPESAEAYNLMGYLNFKQNNFADAESNFSKALEQYPNYTLALYNRAYLKYTQSEYERALADLGKAYSIDESLIKAKLLEIEIFKSQKQYDELYNL